MKSFYKPGKAPRMPKRGGLARPKLNTRSVVKKAVGSSFRKPKRGY